jgi:hypothetical protein
MTQTINSGAIAQGFQALAQALAPDYNGMIQADLARYRRDNIAADTRYRDALTGRTSTETERLAADLAAIEAARAALASGQLDNNSLAAIFGSAIGDPQALEAMPGFVTGARSSMDPSFVADPFFSHVLAGTGVQTFGDTPLGYGQGLDSAETIAGIEADAARYGHDQDLLGTRYTADQDLLGTRYTADANAQSAVDVANVNAGATVDVANVNAASALEVANVQALTARAAASTERLTDLEIAELTAATNLDIAQIEALSNEELAQIAAENDITIAEIGAAADETVAGVLASGRITEAELQAQGLMDRLNAQQDFAISNPDAAAILSGRGSTSASGADPMTPMDLQRLREMATEVVHGQTGHRDPGIVSQMVADVQALVTGGQAPDYAAAFEMVRGNLSMDDGGWFGRAFPVYQPIQLGAGTATGTPPQPTPSPVATTDAPAGTATGAPATGTVGSDGSVTINGTTYANGQTITLQDGRVFVVRDGQVVEAGQ